MFNCKLLLSPDNYARLRFYDVDSFSHDLFGRLNPLRGEKIWTPFWDYECHHQSWGRFVDSFSQEPCSDPELLAFKASESVRCSLSRTRNRIFEYAFCMDSCYFATFTFDSSLLNRYDYDECSAAMQQCLRRLRRYDKNLQYIVIPELHKDGAFHFHGLFSSHLPLNYIGVFKGRKVWHLPDSYFPFGFHEFTLVEDSSRVSTYITGYITKELCAVTKGKRRYWRSLNIQRRSLNLLISKTDFEKFKSYLYDNGGINYARKISTRFFDFQDLLFSSRFLSELPEACSGFELFKETYEFHSIRKSSTPRVRPRMRVSGRRKLSLPFCCFKFGKFL